MTKRTAILFFIPGNPGLSSYYTTFYAVLKAQIPGLEIVTTNHIGFNACDGRLDSQYIDLSAQIAHKIDLLDGIVLGRNDGVPIYIAGHSVGAYIATKVLQARPEHIKHAYLLFPTLSHIARSQRGRVATLALQVPGLITFLSLLTWLITLLIPRQTRLRIVKWHTGFPDEAAEISAFQVLSRNTVYSALTLALTEMREINEPDTSFWAKYGSKCTAYWAREDHWVNDDARRELIDLASGMENYFCDEAPHAFCVSHNELVAKRVGTWMARDMKC